MGGFFGVASKKDCILELFYGVDYHSHLGTRRGGMAAYGDGEFCRAIHNIENSPFRTKFERDVEEMKGNLGIGCISDYEPQPLLIQSHHGSFAIVTVGKINNEEELLRRAFNEGHSHFQEMSGGKINATELVASLICKKASLVEGIQYAQKVVDGSLTLLLMTKDGLYAARDRFGRTPLVIGRKEDAFCVSFENFAYINLGYTDYKELGPGEVAFITPEGVETLVEPGEKMKICSFLWVYYGYPTSSYRESMWRKCAINAEVCWRRGTGTACTRTSWQASRIPAWLMPSDMPMNPASRMRARLSNTPLHGPGPLCLRTRARGT